MATPLVEVKHLKKYFDTPKGTLHAVDDVTFSIGRGKTMGVVGESGCGKSTLGRTIIHLYESTDGQILFDGEDVTRVNKKKMHQLREEMQIIFQDPFASLNPRMTVEDTIREPLELSRRFKKNELQDETDRIMEMVGIDERLRYAYPHELDGGRRQRVGIGRALALNPKFIVCDEPVSALDVSIQAQVLKLLNKLKEEHGLTYIFITHDLSVVEYLADRIAVMYLGRIVELTTSEELFGNTLHPYTQALLSAIPVADVRKKKKRVPLKGDVPSPAKPPKGCAFHPRCPRCTERCRRERPELKEYAVNGVSHLVACHLADEGKNAP